MLDSKIKAAEFGAALPWINVSEPLSLELCRGKIVLLDFWTFCCSDCMQILPYLNKLEKAYAEHLVVIGVHSAKFDNEGEEANVRLAVSKYGIEHPVVCDRGFSLWEKYFIREWPTLVLIDPEGHVVERIPCSKGPYGKLEAPIEALIEEHGSRGTLKAGKLAQIAVNAQSSSGFLRFPGKIIAGDNRLYVSDTGHNRILILNLEGELLDCIGSGQCGAADGSFEEAQLNAPQGLALRFDKQLYIADTSNNLIRRADLNERRLITIAGNGKQRLYQTDYSIKEPLTTALSTPWDLALLDDRLFIAMAGSHQIWCMTLGSGQIEIFAGSGKESLRDGARLRAELSQPSGLAVAANTIYFADSETSSIRALDLASENVSSLVGSGLFAFGDRDGALNEALLQHPLALVCLQKNTLLIADSYNHKIKKLDLDKSRIETLAGSGKAGSADGRDGKLEFSEPGGLALSGKKLYIADTNNHRIMVLDLQNNECRQLALKEAGTSGLPYLPNLSKLTLAKKKLKANAVIKLQLNFQMAPAYHLNEDMPPELFLPDHGIGLSLPDSASFCQIEPGSCSSINLQSGNPALNEQVLNLYLLAYYCADAAGGACFVKSFAVELPFELVESADQKLEVELIID